jgi:hypothetical protein
MNLMFERKVNSMLPPMALVDGNDWALAGLDVCRQCPVIVEGAVLYPENDEQREGAA